ncbi:reverse transcriptase domain-containing protein [Tanacetum coccineum]
MTLELATRTVAYPTGIAEDVLVLVGKFTFPADFVVVDYDVDTRVPLILGRPFVRTAHALVDVHGEELTLRVGDEKLINETEKNKSSIDDPPDLELKDLPPHLEYGFLEGTSKLPVIIAKDLKREEKEQLLKIARIGFSCSRNYNIEIRDKKGAENLAADHLSRLENPYQGDLVDMEMNDNFPHESQNMISLNPDNEPPWFPDIANYLVGNVLIKGMSSQQKKNSLRMFDIISRMTPISLGFVLIRLFDGVWTGRKLWIFSMLATMVPPGDIMAQTTPPRKFLTSDFSGPPYIAMPKTLSHTVTHVSIRGKSHSRTKCPKILFKFLRSLTSRASTFWARSRPHEGTDIYSWLSTMCLNGLK